MSIEKQILEKIKSDTGVNIVEIRKIIKSQFYGIRDSIDNEQDIYIRYLGTFRRKKK